MSTPNSKTDTDSIAITLTGVDNSNISADVIVSSLPGNKSEILSSGLFTNPSSSDISYAGTTLTLTVDGAVSSTSIISGIYTGNL